MGNKKFMFTTPTKERASYVRGGEHVVKSKRISIALIMCMVVHNIFQSHNNVLPD
jgi:hypothetical protein